MQNSDINWINILLRIGFLKILVDNMPLNALKQQIR